MQRTAIIAAIVTLLMLGSAFALIGNSSATGFQSGTVSYSEGYYQNGNFLGSGNQSIDVVTLSGIHVTTLAGPTGKVTLPSGNYYFMIKPKTLQVGSNHVIANGTKTEVQVTGTSSTVTLKDSVYITSQEKFTFKTITPGTFATVNFVTPRGFTFQTNVTNGSVTAQVPSSGSFTILVSYDGYEYTFTDTYSSTGSTIILGSLTAAGFVYNSATGNEISDFSIVLINTAQKTYSMLNFTDGAFNLANTSGYNYMVVGAQGYEGYQFSLPLASSSLPLSVYLNQSSSNVYYNYSLGANPSFLNLSLKYVVGNGTALPFEGNFSVGSLYWQSVLDGGFSASEIDSYLQNVTVHSTNYTITVDGYNYYLTGTYASNSPINSGSTSAVFNATLQYRNSTIKTSDLTSGFTINLYALGTQYTSGAFQYNYQIKYDLPGVALASPTSVATSFKSPVNITPQASNGYLNLKFTPAVKPTLVASELKLFWANMVSSDYVVNSSLNNTVLAVPTGTSVYFNVSQAYFNPVTGDNDYNAPGTSFTWYNVTGSPKFVGTGYNVSIDEFNSSGIYHLMVNYTSASGVYNTTNFSVLAVSPSELPSISLNVSSSGKVDFVRSAISSGSVEKFYVPQSATVQFSGYGTKLTADSYGVPVQYVWYFVPRGTYTGYKSLGENITQTFTTPSFTALNSLKGPITGYLNVTGVTGSYSNITLNITVNDTTPPSPSIVLYNATMTTASNPVAGQITTFSANSSTDPYYSQSDLKYNWSVVYANGTRVAPGNSTFTVVGGALNGSSYVKVQFNTLNSLIMSLKATNPSNVSAYSNRTLTMVVASPKIVVDSAYLTTTPDQGSTVTAYVNVSNNGTVNAASYSITLYVNNKAVTTHTYTNLPVGTTKKVEFNFSSPASGSVTFVFKAYNSSEPSFFADASAYTFTHSVNPPAYKTPLIIVGVIVVIIVISVAYYRLTSRGTRKPKETQTTSQKQQPAKKDEKKK